MPWGKGNNQTFQGLSDTGCELTLVPGDPKRHSGPPVGAGAYGGQEPWSLSFSVCPFPQHSVQASGAGRALRQGLPVGSRPSAAFLFPGSDH